MISLAGYDVWLLIAGIFCAAPYAQAVGRFRCIVQGCCHGDTMASPHNHNGFCVTAPRSRVVSLRGLSLGFLLCGSLILTMQTGVAPPVPALTLHNLSVIAGWSLLGGIIGAVAGSVDCPQGKWPFSRLER